MIVRDQLNRAVKISGTPQRIISLVPSQTELLVDLGLQDRLVGVTKFCVHPKGLRKQKQVIGGTKNYRMELIEELKPDLIIGNKEENDQNGISALADKFPVWLSDIYTLEDSYQMIESLGQLLGVEERADFLTNAIRESFDRHIHEKGTALYLIWQKPLMGVGPNTFIHSMLGEAGFVNVLSEPRYPQLGEDDLISLNPDYILLSSEPYPFQDSHAEYFRKLVPKAKVLIVDGELFSWYGSRLLKSKAYFKQFI
ncbi:ABC transporter substrate-binding protein [Algoriphagus namhaensis]